MSIFNHIKSRVSIVDVVNEYTTLKRAGGYWKARCPFHHEKTASFSVSPGKEIFYCFGCHVSGDAISFIARIQNCTQHEATLFLAERYSIDIPQDLMHHEQGSQGTQEKEQYFKLCQIVAHWYHERLVKSPSVSRYLKERKFTQDTIDYFTIGYCPGGQAGIKQFISDMRQQNILVADLVNANILAEGKTSVYSPFEERIIFPIKDALGRFCGFGGRIYTVNDTRAKYYNSRENENFIKGSLLFGFDLAKKSIQQSGDVFLVEGYTDCMAMVQHGYTNTVATLGTACTAQHLKQLSRYAQQLYIAYDNDTAGQQAVLRIAQLCWQVNLELKVLTFPAGHDPASFLNMSSTLEPCITAAKDIFFYFIESLGAQFNSRSLHEKVQLARKILEMIVMIDDPLKQDLLLQKASTAFDIPFQALKSELARLANPAQNSDTKAPLIKKDPEATPDLEPVGQLEKRIFCAILNNMQLFNEDNRYLTAHMPQPLQSILLQLQKLTLNHTTVDFSLLFEQLSQEHKAYISKLLLEDGEPIDEGAFNQLLLQLHKRQWKIVSQEFKTKLSHAKRDGDDSRTHAILQDFMALKQQMLQSVSSHPTSQSKVSKTDE